VPLTIAPSDPAVAAGFPVKHLAFALAWAAAAPGGWVVKVTVVNDGELVSVVPPGAEFPVFFLALEHGAVETVRQRPAELGGELVGHGSHWTLVEAVLALCPLSASQTLWAWRETQRLDGSLG
jgi:hypothetical protein